MYGVFLRLGDRESPRTDTENRAPRFKSAGKDSQLKQRKTDRLKSYSMRGVVYQTSCGWDIVPSDKSPTGWLTTGYVHTYDPSKVAIADDDTEPTCKLCRRAERLSLFEASGLHCAADGLGE